MAAAKLGMDGNSPMSAPRTLMTTWSLAAAGVLFVRQPGNARVRESWRRSTVASATRRRSHGAGVIGGHLHAPAGRQRAPQAPATRPERTILDLLDVPSLAGSSAHRRPSSPFNRDDGIDPATSKRALIRVHPRARAGARLSRTGCRGIRGFPGALSRSIVMVLPPSLSAARSASVFQTLRSAAR